MQDGMRYYSISEYLKSYFGKKTVKLSLDGGFTCPNRDGTCGYGGCAFCSSEGSGELASNISEQIELLDPKWPDANHLAYFQSHTNTYAPVSVLREKYYEALDDPRICGIAIATRPDCLGEDVLDLLDEINKDNFLWVELGLQTIHSHTSEMLGIGYPLSEYDRAVDELIKRNIRVVTHLILGLPGEIEKDMFESLRYATSKDIFGLKFHLLNIVRGSRLYEMMPDYIPFDSIDDYVDLVVRLLEVTPPDITIHRLTADAPRDILVAPEWSYRKRTILNAINRELSLRETRQGGSL